MVLRLLEYFNPYHEVEIQPRVDSTLYINWKLKGCDLVYHTQLLYKVIDINVNEKIHGVNKTKSDISHG